MRHLFIILIILLSGSRLFAQQEKSYVKKGNDLYQQKKYTEAAEQYNKAVEKKKESVEGQFNLGDAFYKQKQFDKAAEQFNKIGGTSKDKTVTAGAYHNLGNTLLENKKLEESIEAYKKSLLANPKDEQTRYNLAYAMEKLKQQQQQNKDNKDKNKDNKKNQDKKDQDKQNKDQDKKDQDKKDQNKKDQDKKDQNKQDKDQQPQQNKLSKEDAQRMLDALNNQEKETQDKLKGKKVKAGTGKPTKDW